MALTLTNFVQDQIDEIEETYGSLAGDSGSNSNGNWFKFPGGLLIQYMTKSVPVGGITLYLPTQFADDNYVVTGSNGVDYNGNYNPNCIILNSSAFKADCGGASGSFATVHFIAIGRWE